jgi:UDP-N-acetyl-alpha-D-muramoyl-L-alanyl-L-glutamate epimerase
VTDTEREFLRQYYVDGLGEFAFRSEPRLDLTGLEIRGPRLERGAPVGFSPEIGTPLIPFGGGVDSIVTVEMLRDKAPEASLFVVNRPGDRFDAIEKPSVVTGLPTVRADRVLDPTILRSAELGFRNGHVPVTGIISAIAVLAAAVGGHDAVVMSNEWSASIGTVEVEGRSINHQYSKSLAFETGFRRVIAEAIGDELQYFSMLRPFTELWIARRFADLPQYFDTFRSCNRAFHIDRAKRWDHWCGVCDKCAFIDLILAPFVDASVLQGVFAQTAEPLENPAMAASFGTLVGLVPDAKPWECVGDVNECRVALQLAALREDRVRTHLVQELVLRVAGPDRAAWPDPHLAAEALLRPVGEHHIPAWYLPAELRG